MRAKCSEEQVLRHDNRVSTTPRRDHSTTAARCGRQAPAPQRDLRGYALARQAVQPAPNRTRYGSSYWEMYSPKLGRNVSLYRDIEYDHWVLVEADPAVRWYTERSPTITLKVAHRDVSVRFDMTVVFEDGSLEHRRIVDKASSSRRHGYRQSRLIKIEQAWCAMHGYRYRLLDVYAIRQHGWRLRNWKVILSHLTDVGRTFERERAVLSHITAHGACTLRQLENRLNRADALHARATVCWLLYQGLLTAPTLDSAPFNGQTLVRLSHVQSTAV